MLEEYDSVQEKGNLPVQQIPQYAMLPLSYWTPKQSTRSDGLQDSIVETEFQVLIRQSPECCRAYGFSPKYLASYLYFPLTRHPPLIVELQTTGKTREELLPLESRYVAHVSLVDRDVVTREQDPVPSATMTGQKTTCSQILIDPKTQGIFDS
jgi:hypothetical protein